MIKVSQVKISEIAKITNQSKPLISRHFKNHGDDKVTRINNRISGVSPEAVTEYFKHSGLNHFYKPAIILTANLCGGVGKTTSTNNLAAGLRRITDRNEAIVLVDADPQASFTSMIFGRAADDNEPILIDFLENKASIDDILTNIGENTWFVKSNLNQVFIEKVLSKPQDIKKGMLRFYEAIFSKLGPKTKIFQDHTPQLSSVFASSVCAIHQIDRSILRAVIIPIRSDKYAINGGDYILNEIAELKDTYSFHEDIDIHCFFSSIDRRVSTTSEALKVAKTKENIIKHLSPVVIRYSNEIPKSIMTNSNVYHGKSNNAADDYQDLLHYIFSYESHKDI